MSLGQTLRAAREAKGITTSELASRTHLLIQIVEGLENEDFRRIPAPIYGRGFIKLYCETVGLDPKPLQAEFLSIYNSKKNSPGKAPTPSAPPPPPAPPAPKPVTPQPVTPPVSQPVPPSPSVQAAPPSVPPTAEPQKEINDESIPPKVTVDLFSSAKSTSNTGSTTVTEPPPEVQPAAIQESTTEPEPAIEPTTVIAAESEQEEPAPEPPAPPAEPEPAAPTSTSEQSPRRSYGELFEHAYADNEPPKPSAAEKFRDTMSNVSHGVFANVKRLPPNTGRMIMVGIAAVVLLVLIGWGISVLYKATSMQPKEKPAVSKPDATEETAPTNKTTTAAANKDATATTAKNATTSANKNATARNAAAASTATPNELKASGIDVPALYID